MSGATILLIEDYPITRKMMRIALQSENFKVFEAESGSEALAIARLRMPDLVIQDLGLPDIDGVELHHMLRELPGGSKTPIIACTGRATSTKEMRVVSRGFSDILIKPVEPAQLLEAVRTHLRGPKPRRQTRGEGQRVLLADDNPVSRKLARRRLEELDFQVEIAVDGIDALEKARANPPQAILTDVLMPRLDGFQLCLSVRRDPKLAHLPVLLYSASYVTDEDCQLAQRVGAYSLLSRGPTWLDLGPSVAEAIAAGPPPVLELLDAERDTAYFQRVSRQLEAQAEANHQLARRCARQATHLALLRSVSDTLRSSGRTQLPLHEALMHCLDAAGVSRGAILQETTFGPFLILATSGLRDEEANLIAATFMRSAFLRSACHSDAVLQLSAGAPLHSDIRQTLASTSAGSALLVPIRTDSDSTAVLWMSSSGPDFGDADWLDFARGLGDQLAQAMTLTNAFARVTESEERYRQLVEGVQGIVWEADARTGRFTYVSPFAEVLLGHPVHKWLSDPEFMDKLMHPEDREQLVNQAAQSVHHSKTNAAEYRLFAADGRVVWLHETVRMVKEPDGSIKRLCGMMIDVTERKRMDEERAERLRLTAFTAEVTSALAGTGSLGDVLRVCCAAMVQHLDAAVAEIFTHDVAKSALFKQASASRSSDHGDPAARERASQHLVNMIAHQRQSFVIAELGRAPQLADQNQAQCEQGGAFAGHPLIVEGRLVGVIAMFAQQPLTPFASQAFQTTAATIAVGIERRLAEERLAEHRQRLDTLTKVAPMAVYVVRGESSFKLTWVSDSIERISGFPGRMFLDDFTAWQKQIHPEDRDAVMQQFARIREHGAVTTEYRWQCADGTYRTFLDQATLLTRGADSPMEILGSWLDVTPLREAERALRERDEELRQSQKMDSIGRLAGGVAHDFNNLLSVILGYSDLALLMLPPTDPLHPHIGEIKAAGQRATALTRQLLAFSRKQVLEPTILNLNEAVAGMEKMLHRLIGEDIQLTFIGAKKLGCVRADPGQFEQVLLNLVVNARDAMPTGGALLVRTENVLFSTPTPAEGDEIPMGQYVMLSVRDTGIGMNDAVRRRLFEPFFTTKDAGKGTGLGLSTVYGIVRQSGGYLRVETALGKGSTFEIFLPRIASSEASAEAEPKAPGSSPCSETLLFVEDEEGVRRLFSSVLRSCGYTVLEAANGMDAIGIVKQHGGQIHLLLTDVVMPGMSGRQLSEHLTALHPSLRTLYLSGYTDDAVLRHGVRQERVNFLHKPFTPDSLLSHVREAIESRTKSVAAPAAPTTR